MNLIVKQKFSLGFAKFEIYNENEEIVYTAEAKFSFGGRLILYNTFGAELGVVKGVPFSFLPRYEIYKEDVFLGSVRKKFSFFKPFFEIDYNGWTLEGSFSELEYRLNAPDGSPVASISRKAFSWTDRYFVSIHDDRSVIEILLIILCLDEDRERSQRN